uniref:Uncharacterized protein n=1 Tax=Mycena chlorophos TaxID=658473 RepID=A0ABQ0L625_MYCCL|nr:predicted protein [Mycena chlorophos]
MYRSGYNTRVSALLEPLVAAGRDEDDEDNDVGHFSGDNLDQGVYDLPLAQKDDFAGVTHKILDDVLAHNNGFNAHVGYFPIGVAEMAHMFYGLDVSDKDAAQVLRGQELAPLSCRWVLGDVEDVVAEETLPFVRQLFKYIAKARDPTDLPLCVSDLVDRRSALHRYQWRRFIIKRVVRDTTTTFLILPDNPEDEPFILTDGATVLFCLRSEFNSTKDLVHRLVEVGAKFSTCWRRRRSSVRPIRPRDIDNLGRRPFRYNGTMHDYLAYVKLRSSYFRSYRGPLMLREGGILARLARMSINNIHDVVFMCPDDEDLDEAIELADLGDGFALYQEYATSYEKELVSGVYSVQAESKFALRFLSLSYASTDANDKSLKYISWWTMSETWESSARHTGLWNANCERWFQEQTKAMTEGKAVLKTHAKWKSQRFNSPAIKVVEVYHSLAARVVEEYFCTGSL